MNFFSQTLAITAMNLRNVPRRLGNSLVIVIGIAGAVGVFIPIVAMSMSFRATIKGDANDARAIVLTQRATTEAESSLTRDEVAMIAEETIIERELDRFEARRIRPDVQDVLDESGIGKRLFLF